MSLKILPKSDLQSIIEKVRDNIACPYICKGDDGIEVGYCITDEKNDVVTKCILSKTINDVVILTSDAYRLTFPDIRLGVTNSNYVRYWTNNVRHYLCWDLNMEYRVAKLAVRDIDVSPTTNE